MDEAEKFRVEDDEPKQFSENKENKNYQSSKHHDGESHHGEESHHHSDHHDDGRRHHSSHHGEGSHHSSHHGEGGHHHSSRNSGRSHRDEKKERIDSQKKIVKRRRREVRWEKFFKPILRIAFFVLILSVVVVIIWAIFNPSKEVEELTTTDVEITDKARAEVQIEELQAEVESLKTEIDEYKEKITELEGKIEIFGKNANAEGSEQSTDEKTTEVEYEEHFD